MNPITREEQYLNRLTGEEGIIPDKPVTREEQYFARLCGGDNVIPDKPVTRREQYLATLCGEDVITPTKPVTRIEQYMAFASGESESKPEKPITREEMYWDKYQGGDVPEEKTIAFTDIITVTDALARPAVDLQSEITATQNLNGYEYPWVGGAGKNKVDNKNFTRGLPSTSIGASQSTIIASTRYAYYGFNINGGNYTVSAVSNDLDHYDAVLIYGYKNGVLTDYILNFIKDMVDGHVTVELGDCDYMRVCIGAKASIEVPTDLTNYGTLQAEIGSTATAYAPYENICPISGRTEVEVTRTGKNLLQNTATTQTINDVTFTVNSDGTISLSGTATANTVFDIPNFSAIGGTAYILNGCPSGGSTSTYLLSIPGVGYDAGNGYNYNPATDATITVRITIYNGQNTNGLVFKPMIRLATFTDAEYEPYEGDTFNTELGRTVYGGTLDLTTGELTITHAYVDLGDLTWTLSNVSNTFQIFINEKKSGQTNFITTSYRTVNKGYADLVNGEATCISPMPHAEIYRQICIKDERATTAEEFTTLVTGQKMVYELATPQTISLTPTEVMMLENNNTIWADSGRVQLTYLSKAAERVQLMNASLKANTLKLSKGAIKE